MELITVYMETRKFNYKRYVFTNNDVVKIKDKLYRFIKEDCGQFVCRPINANKLDFIYFAKDDLILVPKILYSRYNIIN